MRSAETGGPAPGQARRPVVTGVGLHSALGGRHEVIEAVAAGETGVHLARPDGADGFPLLPVARADLSVITDVLEDRKLRKYMSRSTELAVIAAGRALDDAGLIDDDDARRSLALFMATGPIAFDLSTISRALARATGSDGRVDLRFVGDRGLRLIHPLLPFKMLLNMPLGLVSIVFGVGGENLIVYPGTVQAGAALEAACRGIAQGRFARALVGGCEQAVAALPLASAGRRGWLATDLDAAQPFTEAHEGLAAGELGAFLVVEAGAAAASRGAAVRATISGLRVSTRAGTLAFDEHLPPPERLIVTGSAGAELDDTVVEAARRAWPSRPPPVSSFDGVLGFARSSSIFAHLAISVDAVDVDDAAQRRGSVHVAAIDPDGGAVQVSLGLPLTEPPRREPRAAGVDVRRRRRVVVTGVGVVSPIGVGRAAFHAGLAAGRSGIGTIRSFDASTYPSRLAGEVKGFDRTTIDVPDDLGPALSRDPKALFGIAAAREALSHAFGSSANPHAADRRGLFLSGGLEIVHLDDVAAHLDGDVIDHGAFFDAIASGPVDGLVQLPADLGARVIGRELGAETITSLNLSACAAGAQALGEAYRAVADGVCDMALAGGYDSMVNPLGVGGFCMIEALSRSNDAGPYASRPFDVDRDGFVLGEGAAVVVFEELEAALGRGAQLLGEVLGYGSSLDAYRVSDPAPDNAAAMRAIRAALDDAGLAPSEISYINAHGTGTIKNDPAEAQAIRGVFGEAVDIVPVSSTKSQIGHLIGAAGAVEFCAGLFALETQTLPATITLRRPGPSCELCHVAGQPRPATVRTFLSTSFGFGGQNAAIVAGAIDERGTS